MISGNHQSCSSSRAAPRSRLAAASSGLLATSRSAAGLRSEEHTSELQSPCNLVCRLLLEKKKIYYVDMSGPAREKGPWRVHGVFDCRARGQLQLSHKTDLPGRWRRSCCVMPRSGSTCTT